MISPRFARLRRRRLTLLGRATALIAGELAFNAACWVAAALTLRQADGLIGLALLAWTIGLRHGLDADHISAIDNATRQLVSQGQLPITCGLWFSLGHSTIVIAVNIAIAISVDIYDKLDAVGSVGGIIGASVSASFLFLIACLNIYFLTTALRERRRIKRLQAAGLPVDPPEAGAIQGGGCLVRIIGPVLRAVDRPWKMYPVGVLFGFGFDTASSIALLAISAIAQRGANGQSITHGKIVILPFLFTAGMSLVDSLDSVLMLYAYAPLRRDSPDGRLTLFCELKVPPACEPREPLPDTEVLALVISQDAPSPVLLVGMSNEADPRDEHPPSDQAKVPTDSALCDSQEDAGASAAETIIDESVSEDYRARRMLDAKASTMSSLSITLTVLSILVALSISLIEIMGLIGDNCTPCQAAADAPDGGGLAGSWWRFWAAANDQSGYIGAAIVGVFAAILLGYHLARWGWRKWRKRERHVEV